jgi:hypothetical protein
MIFKKMIATAMKLQDEIENTSNSVGHLPLAYCFFDLDELWKKFSVGAVRGFPNRVQSRNPTPNPIFFKTRTKIGFISSDLLAQQEKSQNLPSFLLFLLSSLFFKNH